MSAWEAAGRTDEWYTPAYIFDALACVFDLDVAAPISGPRHVPAVRWMHEKSLESEWYGLVWMNPPYGPRNGLVPWLEKFVAHGHGIALVPDRTSAPWFQHYAPLMGCVLFLNGKVKFERPDGSIGGSPGCGSALFGIGAGNSVVRKAHRLGLLVEPMSREAA